MSSAYPRRGSPGVARARTGRSQRELLMIGGTWLAALVLALGIAVAMPRPQYALVFAAVAGAVAIVVLIAGRRLEVKVAILGLYLLMLDGPVKLLAGGGHEATSGLRDILIVAVCLAPVLGLVVRRERVVLPPLSGWVVGWVALVLVEAFNPNTAGFLHALGGFRQLLEWVPFFFFGYALMRSKRMFRKAFLILGVAAAANGAIATYQTFLSPGQVAAWGPGYHNKIYPVSGKGGRAYSSEGEGRVRPLGLGSDSGFGGGVGIIALPCTLALLAMWRGRRRWLIVLLNLGALVAIITSLGRLQVVGAGLGVLAFVVLSAVGARRVSRPLAAVLGVIALAVPLGAVFVSTLRSGTFSRYESIGTSSTSYKSSAWEHVPHLISVAPFGVGLGSVGPVAGLGGKVTEQVEGRAANAETQWNFLVDEVGAPGLVLWVGLAFSVIMLAMRRLRRIPDVEMRIALAAVVAPLIALLLMGFSGPLSTSAALGPFYWFAAGVAAYWFAGPGWNAAVRARPGTGVGLAPPVPSAAAGL